MDTKTVEVKDTSVVAVHTPPLGEGLGIGVEMGVGLELELIGGLTGGVGAVGNGNVVGRVRVDVGPSIVDGVKITGPFAVEVVDDRGGS